MNRRDVFKAVIAVAAAATLPAAEPQDWQVVNIVKDVVVSNDGTIVVTKYTIFLKAV